MMRPRPRRKETSPSAHEVCQKTDRKYQIPPKKKSSIPVNSVKMAIKYRRERLKENILVYPSIDNYSILGV
ncbi:hypothetical protein ACFLWB_01560 [Chloroflexota bacterium]